MKKILLLLTFAIVSFASFAQTESLHLAFKGVPIDGTLTEYVQKMKQQGFTYVDAKYGIAIMKGELAGHKNCEIGIMTFNNKDVVSVVGVKFSDCSTWGSLSGSYFSLKNMLCEKYGEPSDFIEEFQSGSQPQDDGSKMALVKLDMCEYRTTYETEKGRIQLSINHEDITSCYVMLIYFDRINGEIIKKEAMDDL